jgi:hypothetical protein
LSKISYNGANVESSDTFAQFVDAANRIIADMGNVVVTTAEVAQPNTTNGGATSGNAHIDGIFSSNELTTDSLRGGSVSQSGLLKITSNTAIIQDRNDSTFTIGANTNIFAVSANNTVFDGSIALNGISTANTLPVNTNNTRIATTAFVKNQIGADAPSKTGVGASGSWNINSATSTEATRSVSLKTPRNISLTGDATGTVAFDGTANVSINVVVADNSHNHTLSNITGSGTMASQNANSVNISGGSITNITPIAINSGGTGASSAPVAVSNLGFTKTATIISRDIVIPSAIMYFMLNYAPPGWLKANGAAVSRTTYADLFSYIGTNFGSGNGSTTFNLPDLRGLFLRSWDEGRGIDGGRGLWNIQGDAIRNIYGTFHLGPTPLNETEGADGPFSLQSRSPSQYTGHQNNYRSTAGIVFNANAVVPTAAENRPINYSLLACIKY